LREALELPGEPSDYHFALMGVYQALWQRRRNAPELLTEIETLCLLDIHLVEAQPSIVVNVYGNGPRFLQVPAFSQLIQLYEREGFLHAAIDIASRAQPFEQQNVRLAELQERLVRLKDELGTA
jgi:hypothetical protein